jgi:hypothetical protein
MSQDREFAPLLENVETVTIELARNLLDAEGIPSIAQGPDFDVAELGRLAHGVVRRQDLLVPRSALSRARDVLRAAWGEETPLAIKQPRESK